MRGLAAAAAHTAYAAALKNVAAVEVDMAGCDLAPPQEHPKPNKISTVGEAAIVPPALSVR